VTVYRYRGVDQAARMVTKWSFLDLTGLEFTLTGCGRVLTPARIVAVGRAFAAVGGAHSGHRLEPSCSADGSSKGFNLLWIAHALLAFTGTQWATAATQATPPSTSW
jgi:hypothetical protein